MHRTLLVVIHFMVYPGLLYAQFWNPEVGALLTYTGAIHYADVVSGPFACNTRSVNYGFDFTNEFHVSKRLFAVAGFRYQHFQTNITGFNQVAILQNEPPPFKWEKRYQLFTIPLSIGWQCGIKQGELKLSPWVGGSVGILSTSYARWDVYKALKKDLDNKDLIYIYGADTANPVPTYGFVSADFGINGEFKALPRWRIGLLGSVQLNRPKPYHYGGFTGNVNTGEHYVYSMNHSQRFLNCTLRLACKLGNLRKRALRHQNPWDCPPGN